MPNYTKLFNSIITSTIWTEDDKTRIIWITLLAMSDQHGEVQASIPGLARIAGVTIEDCEASIKKLMSPDAYSRTPDFEGRRISPIDGGWELLNHGKYRLMASKEDEKANNAKRQRRHRERNASVTDSNANVTPSNDEVTQKRDIVDTDTKADTKADNTNTQNSVSEEESSKKKTFQSPNYPEFEAYLIQAMPLVNPEWTPERVSRASKLQYETYEENGWKDGNGKQVKNWKTKAKTALSFKKPWNYGNEDKPKSAGLNYVNTLSDTSKFVTRL